MSKMSEPRADLSGHASEVRRVLVWDVPVRLFHWLMVASFAGAWLTGESESLRLLHVTLGYTMGALVAFRIVWGVMGTRYARFSTFVRGPKAIVAYVRGILRGQPEHHVGHNPLGALAVLALLGLTLAVMASGWFSYNDIAGKSLEEAHEVAAAVMLAIVGIHVAGVLFSSWLHRENLVGAMVTGTKPGLPEQGIRRPWRSVAVLMVAGIAGIWWQQWQGAPEGSGYAAISAMVAGVGDHDRDDD